jgi:LCP family protein required for cell wall assembly
MRIKTIFSITAIILILSGCSLPGKALVKTPIPLTDLGENYPATPTPFQPVSETTQPSSTPTTAAATLTPMATPSDRIYLGLNRPDGQVNILLLGSDWRPGEGFRTDVIMLLSMIPEQGIVTLTSFPRDLYVQIPGVGYERINAAMVYGGFELLQETMKYNFDAPVDYYMMTNFAGFVGIVDTLGGIKVNAAYELYDRCDLPQAVYKYCYVAPGFNYMDGDTALWYVRSRYSTSDFDRTRRAQEVIQAIFQQAMSLDGLNRASEFYELFKNSIETDLPFSKMVELLPISAKILADPSIVQRFAIGESDVTHFVTDGGAMVLIPNIDPIREIIRAALYP